MQKRDVTKPMDIQSFIRNRKNIIFGIAVIAISSLVGAHFLAPLYVELQISLFGREAEATVVKVETFERDDGDRAWTVDYINYKFEIPGGYVFTGVNEANSSETDGLIGRMDASGNYGTARVEYVSSHPEWHRLKGWGYGGLGPPGALPELILRMCLVIGIVIFAYVYAYELFRRSGSKKSSD
jgi:hypothetical protein